MVNGQGVSTIVTGSWLSLIMAGAPKATTQDLSRMKVVHHAWIRSASSTASVAGGIQAGPGERKLYVPVAGCRLII